MDEKGEEGDDVFKMSNFDFVLVGTKLVGDRIVNISTSQSKQEGWTQVPPSTQGPNLAPPSSPQDMVVDKGSVTPLIPRSEEQVQKEPSQEEQLDQRETDEPSKEGKIVEYPRSLS